MSTTLAPPHPSPGRGPREPDRPLKGIRIPDEREQAMQRRSTIAFTVFPLIGLVVAIVLLWGWGVSALDLGIALGFYAFTGLGVTVGYHRLFTHRSFETRAPVRAVLAVAGSMSVQGSILSWVAAHRRHHAYSDQPGDPHSPHLIEGTGWRAAARGLWHAHLGWFLAPDRTVIDEWAPDLVDDPIVSRVDRAFPHLTVATFVLPPIIGLAVTGSLWGAITAFIWGSLVRICLLHHITFSINSICHYFGTRPFRSRDHSRNNWMMALIGFGEGWHNAHHAFPTSARHGLRWWEFDLSWVVIRTLAFVRLVRNIKLPTPAQVARRRM